MTCYDWLQTDFNLNENSTSEQISSAFRYWNLGGLIFVSLLLPPGIIGNLLIIYVYWKFKRSSYRTFVLWLACLDLAGCVFTMPYLLINLYNPVTMTSAWLCKFGKFVSYMLGMTSHFVLVIIAFDRHQKICRPYSKPISTTTGYKCCLFVLFLAILISIPAAILYGNNTIDYGIIGLDTRGTRCFTADQYMDGNYTLIHYSFLNVLGGIVTGIMCLLYFQIIRQIKRQYDFNKHKRSRITTIKKEGKNENERRTKRVMRTAITFLAITLIFVFTVFPHTILALIDYIFKNFYSGLDFKSGLALNTVMYIFLLNNVSNCFIYGFSDKRFQKKLKRMFKTETIQLTSSKYLSSEYDSNVRSSS